MCNLQVIRKFLNFPVTVTVLYCSQRDGRVSLYDPVIGNDTRYVIVIVYNYTVNTYYQSPKPELVLLPSPSSLPSVTFLHCCCRQLFYHQFSCNSCGLCQDMEHRLGAALRSGSSVLTAVVSDNTALHTAIHTAIQRVQRALQVGEGHQLTAGAEKLASRMPANFSSLK